MSVATKPRKVSSRAETIDWLAVSADLDSQGWTILPKLLSAEECDTIAGFYHSGEYFRSQVVMARHGFGRGEYKYFAYPLPPLIESLRTTLYPHLAPIANRWHDAMGIDIRFPAEHAAFIERCHAAGQTRPTPLLLQYGAGDYNCLHQDLYGEHVFPLQVAILLSRPRGDFKGGEFVLTEQRPRMQSRAVVVPLTQGDADLCGEQPASAGRPWLLPRQPSPRCQPGARRPSPYARDYLPRCRLSCSAKCHATSR